LALIEDEGELPERPVEKMPNGTTKELPILPNLKANVKTADSLVVKEIQVNGKNLILPRTLADRFRIEIGKISEKYRQKIERIFDGAIKNPERELEEVKKEIFREFIEVMYEKGKSAQTTLDGEVIYMFSEDERRLIRELYNACQNGGSIDIPFIWQIDFARVFAEGGFDIVVSNPPYVKNQKIYPEFLDLDEFKLFSNSDQRTLKEKYKDDIKESVEEAFRSAYRVKIDLPKKFDLYAYFFVHSITLLKPSGILVYITSNSWLDTEFGEKLQEFFLRYTRLKNVYDSHFRSFVEAEINTVITVVQRKKSEYINRLENKYVNFIKFKKSYDMIDINDIQLSTSILPVTNYDMLKRYYILNSAEILEYDCESMRIIHVRDIDLAKIGYAKLLNQDTILEYKGNKWGSLLLKVPSIYFEILEKGKDKLKRLIDLVQDKLLSVNEGKPTGANNFAYLTNEVIEEFGIEPEFLKPALMKARGIQKVVLDESDVDRYLLSVNLPKDKLQGFNVLKYIEYGEKLGINKKSRTLAGKKIWYYFKARPPAELILPCGINDSFFCALNKAKALTSNNFAEIRFARQDERLILILWGFFNSTLGWLTVEIFGRSSLGGGMLKLDPVDYRKMYVLVDVSNKKLAQLRSVLDKLSARKIKSIFEELGLPKPNKDLSNIDPENVNLEKIMPDRRELDKIVFEVLGLTEEEQLEVYKAVVELVKWRLAKAQSV